MENYVNSIYLYRDTDEAKQGFVLNFFMTLVWALVELTPYLSRNTSGYFRFGLFLLWFLSLFFIASADRIVNNKFFIIPILIIGYQLFMAIVGLSNTTMLVLIDRWRLYFIPLGMYIILKCYPKNLCQSLFKWLLAIYLANLLVNIYLFASGLVDNEISVGDVTLGASARQTNAGDTSFCFLTSFFALISLFLIRSKNKLIKFLGIVSLVLSIWYLFFLNARAISIMLLLLGAYVYLCFIFVYSENRISKSIKVLMIIALSTFLLFNFTSILSLLGSIKGNDWMEEKMEDLTRFLTGGGLNTYGSLYSRFTFYGYSISTYLKSPFNFIFGIGEQNYAIASSNILQSIGISGHSDIFDEAAQYGTIGLVLMFSLYYGAFKYIKNLTTDKKKIFAVRIMAAIFFIYGFINHFTYGNVFFATFILFPLYIKGVY